MSVPLTKRRLQQALGRYELGSVSLVEILPGGMFLKPVHVITETGEWVLRGHRFRNSEEAFRFQASTLDALRQKGVRCPRVLPDRFGKLGFEWGDAFWAVYEYIPGHKYSWTEWESAKTGTGFLERLGEHVALVHDMLSSIRPCGDGSFSPFLPPVQFSYLDMAQDQWHADIARLTTNSSCAPPSSRAALLENRVIIAEMWKLLTTAVVRDGLADLSLQLVHGDISPVNLIFEGETATLIDWDCLHYGVRIYDLLGDVVNRPSASRAGGSEFRREEAERLLCGYDRVSTRPFSREERRAIATFSMARQLEDLRQRMAVLPSLTSEEDADYAALIRGRVSMLNQIAAPPRLGMGTE
jgi:Ser/Thr protein kinase RdoA (MazF antagonist)